MGRGKCLSKTIKNAKSKVDLECTEGHKFTTTYNSLVYSNSWCPECHIYVAEAVCRKYFEHIFKRPFPKSYPPWLINKNGNQMELDMYNKNLALAGEYQGIQHRKKAFGLTDEDVKNIQDEDTYRLKKCEENGVILLQIPDEEIVPYDSMQNFIIQEYERKSGKKLEKIPYYDYHKFSIRENEHAKKFRIYVEEKGGTLLSPYFSARKRVTLLCEEGHQWITTPNSIYMNNWCPECAGNRRGTSEEFQEIVQMFNCELLEEYTNAKTSLQLKCDKGHEFIKDPYWLKKNYKNIEMLCPECQMEIYADNFKEIVHNKGGEILSPYEGRFKPIKIRCEKGHVWKPIPGAIYQGHWCKICSDPNQARIEAAKNQFLELLKTGKYSLISDYKNNTVKVEIRCRRNHKFTTTPKNFKQLVKQEKEPCPKCR